MHRLMVDTNVLLDFIGGDRPAHADAMALFRTAIGHEDCELYALALSLKDVYFIYERHYGSESLARRNVSLLSQLLVLCTCDAELVQLALDCGEPDFEDGLVRCAAERAQLDGIVTRDKPGFGGSPVRKLAPYEAVQLLEA